MQEFIVTQDSVDERLDVFLASVLDGLSRASVQKLLKQGNITIDGEAPKGSYKTQLNDKVHVELEPEAAIPNIDLTVIYEDDDCLVVIKPEGLLSHSKGAFNPEATVATFLQQHKVRVEGDRGGIVHRLDRATSGVMVCAKTPEAFSWLQKQFSQRKVKKTYIAIIDKPIELEHAIIDMPIERNPKKPQTFRVGNNGKVATTEYEVIASNDPYQLLKLSPHTGRTHQLRVHLLAQKCPILGDTLYGGTTADRMYLHAHKLELTLPNRERKVFESPVPESFSKYVSCRL